MTNDKNMTKKPVIIIDEKPDVVAGQAVGETPVITIEEGGGADAKPIHRRWLTTLVAAAAAVATCVLLIGGGLLTGISLPSVCLSVRHRKKTS